jgi:phenylacetate-CoA ligase
MNDVWDPIETAPADAVRRLDEERLQTQLDYLFAKSEFYRRKLGAAGIRREQLKSREHLADVPFTYKQEIRDSLLEAPPLGLHLAAPLEDVIQIQSSSGTTGMPTYVAGTRADVETWNTMGARVFYANGFRPGERVLHAYAMSRGFVGGLVNVQHLQHLGCCEIPLGAESGTERLLTAARHLAPAALAATPSMAVYLGEAAEQVLGIPARELSIRKISVGGEPVGGEAVRRRIEELWAADVRDMMGGADFGSTYWAECEHKDGMHLCSQGAILVEIIDPATGDVLPVEEGTEGELTYTAIRREASPLLRYRMGDIVEVVGTSCDCGRTGYRINVRGRADDMLIVRGVNVYPAAIKEVVMQLAPRTTGFLKLMLDFEGHATTSPLKLRAEYANGLHDDRLPELAGDIESRIRDILTVRVQVELVPEGSIERPGDRKEVLLERVAHA